MKKIITLLVTVFAFGATVSAQCIVRDLAVDLHSVVVNGGQCTASFDLSWEQEVNNGNKFAYIHLWRTDQYPALEANNLAYSPTSNHPDEIDLALALATIAIEDNGTATPFIGTTYYPVPTFPVLSAGLSISKEVLDVNWERMTIKNITLNIPNCTGTRITGDIWASQAANGVNVHCVTSGYSVVIGNPVVSGNLYCQLPHQYDVIIKNAGDTAIDVTYNIFIDEGDAVYEPTLHDLKITPIPQGPITLAPGQTYNSGRQSYLPYAEVKPYSDNGLWIEVTAAGFPNKAIYFVMNNCNPLAVNYSSFAAVRVQKEVKLMWQTMTEDNNYGFEIQRRTGNNEFRTIAFVPSKAQNGKSASALNYSYNDLNLSMDITEYRNKQINLDGGFTLSKIIAVRGEGQGDAHFVYPNPANANKVVLLFKTWNAYYDIDLIDVSGRVVKRFQQVPGQRLEMTNVPQGMYILKVIDKAAGVTTTERVMVFN